jgi:hypothetical protein
VLLLAGAFEPVDEARAADTGCAGVLVKPFEPQLVIARVRGLLDGRRSKLHVAGAPDASSDPAADTEIAQATMPPAPVSEGTPPAAPAAMRASSVDDYFERLDAAFASINANIDEPRPRAAASLPAPLEALSARPAPGAPAGAEAMGPLSMADAFGALLGVEQGAPPPLLPDAWAPIVTDDLVDQVARRVADQVGERVARELVPEIVTRVAERLVREEIARIRSEAEPDPR